MARNVGKVREGGAFFKPAQHVTDYLLIVETKELRTEVPNTYQGKTTLRDEVTADITVFGNAEAVDQGRPTDVLKDVTVGHGALVNGIKEGIPMEFYLIVRKEQFGSGNSGYVFREVDAGLGKKAEAYMDKRDAERQAALAAVPDFG